MPASLPTSPFGSAVWQARLERAFAAYDGDSPAPLLPGPNGVKDSVIPNRARVVVDGLTNHAIGTSLSLAADDSASVSDIEQVINDLWPEEQRLADLYKARTLGGVAGHSFVRVVPTGTGIRTIVLDPASVQVETDPMDDGKVLRYIVTVEVQDKLTGGRTYRRQTHERVESNEQTTGWTITDEVGDGYRWTVTNVLDWPSTLCQIVDVPNLPSSSGYWGRSDIEPDTLDLIEASHRILSNCARIARNSAFPLFVSTGITDEDSQDAIGRIGPGQMAHLADESQSIEVVESTGTALTSALDLYNKIVEEIALVTAYPDLTNTDAALFGGASGRALEVRLAPMIARVEALRRSYGQLAAGIATRALAFIGIEPPVFTTVFDPILPPDQTSQIANAQALLALGVSKATAFEAAGLDPAVEAQRLAEEQGALAATQPQATPTLGALLSRLGAPTE